MNRAFVVDLFAEDAAHEAFLVPFIKRLAAEEGASVEVKVRSAMGGHGKALTEFELFQKTLPRDGSAIPDLIVVCIDANCKKYSQSHREIVDCTDRSLRERVVIASPDPHVERWYMADLAGFASAVGAEPSIKKRKCERDYYKAALASTIRQAGHMAPLGGIEFAQDLVEQMDVFRAGKSDKSLKAFADELKKALHRLRESV